MSRTFRCITGAVAASAVAIAVVAGPAGAGDWRQRGWRDRHYRYPGKPSGYSEIVKRFGQPCNARARKIAMRWRAADNGVRYTVRFHKRLGGFPTEMVSDKGGRSTNLDNDVYGHIKNQHLSRYVLSGIWGYNCRYISGTTSWSAHAWGIAVDVSSAHEPNGQCVSEVNKHHARIWRYHRWKWGRAWCDPMHFQYARDY